VRRSRTLGGIAQAPEERRRRKTGGKVRSGKNAIIKVSRREERRQVRAPNRETGRRRGKARGERSVKNSIADDC